MLEDLKKSVCAANLKLPEYGLVTFTWGNVSAIDNDRERIVIKPSGVAYEALEPEDFPVIRLSDGLQIEGRLKPSSDTPTHLALYRAFPEIGGIVHTHSRWATIFAQMQKPIPPLGTTHADYFYGEIPCTGLLSSEEISGDYESETGHIIERCFAGRRAADTPAVLVASHGPFAWGKDADEAVHNAVVLEEVAFMAWHAQNGTENLPNMQQELMDKHYFRKHGEHAYYGQ